MRRTVAILIAIVTAGALAGCPDTPSGQVKCQDGTVQQRNNKGSVVCHEHGGEAWK